MSEQAPAHTDPKKPVCLSERKPGAPTKVMLFRERCVDEDGVSAKRGREICWALRAAVAE